jgi:hypothetical protein
VQLVEALRYNPENVAGSILEGSLKFCIDMNLPAALWSWDRFLLGEGGRCLELITKKFCETQTPGALRVCPDLYRVYPDLYRVCPDLYRVCPDLYRGSVTGYYCFTQ